MIKTARKHVFEFTGLAIEEKTKLEMPIWNHIGVKDIEYKSACARRTAWCLRERHEIQTVAQALQMANRKTTDPFHPHTMNTSGISRQNCGCEKCKYDRNILGCINPGECIKTSQMLILSLNEKWSPLEDIPDLLGQIQLTDEERAQNLLPISVDSIKTFNPDYRVKTQSEGCRIFAEGDCLKAIPAKRYITGNIQPSIAFVDVKLEKNRRI